MDQHPQQQPLPPEEQGMERRIQMLELMVQQQAAMLENVNLRDGAPAAEGGERNLLKAPTYDGTSPFIIWRQNFEEVAFVNRWTQETAKKAAKASLAPPQQLQVFDLNPNAYLTLSGLLDALQGRFVPLAQTNLNQSNFEIAVQKPGESTLEWHSRARLLFLLAYPGCDIQSSAQLKRKFLRGLKDPVIQDHAMTQPSSTYDEVLNIAQWKEGVMKETSFYRLGAQHAPFQHGEEPMQIGSMEGSAKGKVKGDKQGEPCPVCKKTNHSINFCWQLKKMQKLYEEEQMSKSQKGTKGKGVRKARKALVAALADLDEEDGDLPTSEEEESDTDELMRKIDLPDPAPESSKN